MNQVVLIVDDEASQLRMAEFVVRDRLGYKTITATNGQTAIDHIVLRRQPVPDLILLDLVMPVVGGLDVIRAVKAHSPHIPVVVLTQYGDNENAARAVQAGANDFLNKPVVLERLRLSVRNALSMRQMEERVIELEGKLGISSQPRDCLMAAKTKPGNYFDESGRLKKLADIEEEAIYSAIENAAGCMTKAAKSLGIGRSTLYRKLETYEARNTHRQRANQTTRPMMRMSLVEHS